jgi:uncharacterized cupin superfamily protein
MTQPKAHVVNVHQLEETPYVDGEHWGSHDKRLTPDKASLGVNYVRLPRGRAGCPFHSHQLETEVFIVVSGRGILRYGDELRALVPGDCVYCAAGTGIAHQLANPFEEDLVYYAIGPREPNEVCVYPDNGKVMVRSLQKHGYLTPAPYMEGEPELPAIFELAAQALGTPKP